MKVLLVCNKAPFPPIDGSSIAIYNMAKGLKDNAVDLSIFSLNTKKHFKADDEVKKGFPPETSYYSVYVDTSPTVMGAIFNLFSSQSYFVSRFLDSTVKKELELRLKETDFDIIQLEGVFMALYIPLIRKTSKAKIVLRAHNIEYLIWDRYITTSNSWFRKIYLRLQTNKLRKFEQGIFRSVDAIVPITQADSVQITNFSVAPKHTAIAGVEVKKYLKNDSLGFDPNTVFHFGSMDWIPNQEAVDWFLTKCWPTITSQVQGAKFIIAGRNIPKRFKQLASENIIIRENVPDSAEIYSKYNIMIVPVLSGSGMRIKIVEGLCYGKAIVSTHIGAEGINASHGREIVLCDEAKDFANAVIQLLKNDNQRVEIEKNGLTFAKEHFDYLQIATQLVAFYKKLIQS